MPRALLINPNSTQEMTASMVVAAKAVAPDVDFVGWTSRNGPPAIQGPEDGARAVPPLLDLVARAGPEIDIILIGCFDDTGLEEANAVAACPVIGIGQAAFHLAALRGERFSVVTTLEISVPVIEANIRRYGLERHLGRVRASDLPVLETTDTGVGAAERIAAEADRAVAEDGCDCIILGCGGMARLAADLRARVSVPVLDGVEAAARLTGALT
ncbi:aspartate/glutamate racemase family protein [Tropicimonas sp. TH_r6]|uniref:aspartate/glutamate racemase family protein n=1 Tax=Tropicimonas sp. TH_r6 TaxID=3082085 RepID=UPI0029547F45|nr:aspartate/glutamate racemase family protein [Tropicimonas sp. TH_r6]MDV7141769.1 aspartate/glutamate racemase family protein [Tropicimonas sp. TH_r6]